jgi:hypothetical protein
MGNIYKIIAFISLTSLTGCAGCGPTEGESALSGCMTQADCLEGENCINNVCSPVGSNFYSDGGTQHNTQTPQDSGINAPEPTLDSGPVIDFNDPDGDGIINSEDDDDDNDGLTDIEETEFGTDCSTSSPVSRDTDMDGILDPVDAYPYDPWPEFMVREAEQGRIELFLSNRDGSFETAVLIGSPVYGNPDGAGDDEVLRFTDFAIGDFDHDGKIDFLAKTSVSNPDEEYQVWFFTRDIKKDEFAQRLIGYTQREGWAIVMDANGDSFFDIATFEVDRPNYVTGAKLHVYINNRNPEAECFAQEGTDHGCFFQKLPALSIDDVVSQQWSFRFAKQAVNLNPEADDYLDISVGTYASGGASPTKTYSLFGNGDGTFQEPVLRFTHAGSLGPANSMLFADFNNDDIGDVITGFDDDGQHEGSGWFYAGQPGGTLSSEPIEAIDLNPTDANEMSEGNVGAIETLGRTGSARTFDFDFDGNYDLIVGYNHENYNTAGQTRLFFGMGDGTFDPDYVIIGENSEFIHRFNVPQKLCPTYETATGTTDTETPTAVMDAGTN